jgi:hypothetical protein
MILPSKVSLHEPPRFGRVALTALVIGLGAAAVSAVPLADIAFADKGGNGGGNGGGGGKGGGKGGGSGHGSGHGGGNGGGQGPGGGNAGGNGHGQGHGQDGAGNSAKAGKASNDVDVDESADVDADDADNESIDDGSLQASKLGKLNGFLHASPNALAHASPNSAIGRISQTFRDALSDYAEASQDEEQPEDGTDPAAEPTPPTGPSVEDLGAILAGATNTPVTAAQVEAIIDRLAEQNPDDDALNDLADNLEDAAAQDIADAANAAKSGEPRDQPEDDGTDTSTDTSTEGGADAPPVTAATN